MARRKRKKKVARKEQKDLIVPTKKPEKFTAVDSSIYWEANPDKSKKYGNKDFKGKKNLTPKEAAIFLGVTSDWLCIFVAGEKGFPKLKFSWDGSNPATIKFARTDLMPYRDMLPSKKQGTKARQISKFHEHERDQ